MAVTKMKFDEQANTGPSRAEIKPAKANFALYLPHQTKRIQLLQMLSGRKINSHLEYKAQKKENKFFLS